MELERANRITVQVVGEGYLAVFHRTHKEIKHVMSADTNWVPDTRMNKTAQREMFRIYMMDHAPEYGIQYDAEDRRESTNQMPRKYESDADAMMWASRLVRSDVEIWVGKMNTNLKTEGISLVALEGDDISGRGGWNGRAVNPRYSSGAWAYADVHVTATLRYTAKDGTVTEGYVGMHVNIVSGQMKKPSNIGEMGYTYTGFSTEALVDLKGAIEADMPKQESPQPKDETPAPSPETPQGDTAPDTTEQTQSPDAKKSGKRQRRSK